MSADTPFAGYRVDSAWDEMFLPGLKPRPEWRALHEALAETPAAEIRRRKLEADRIFAEQGITIREEQEPERAFPHDLIPRLISAADWAKLERGLAQRIRAMNMFLGDIYHEGHIFRDGVVPRQAVESSPDFLPAMKNVSVPRGVYVALAGTDLIRLPDGRFAVLEDNVGSPSGAAYMLASRMVMKRVFAELFRRSSVRPVEIYAQELAAVLDRLNPSNGDPKVVLLSDGADSPGHFESAFLARQLGVELVEPRDLAMRGNRLHVRTVAGLDPVDVMLRLSGEAPESIPGVLDCCRQGTLAVVNAPGSGVAGDKAVFAYMTAIIRYYLKEEPVLENVGTYLLSDASSMAYVEQHLDELVVKPVANWGRADLLIGPQSTPAEREAYRARILAQPRAYIAQPVIQLSNAPCLVGSRIEPRHVDLRAYVLVGENVTVIPGGLTRLALREGALAVDRAEAGAAKDTWVLRD